MFVSRELHSVERKEAEAGPQILSLKLTVTFVKLQIWKKKYTEEHSLIAPQFFSIQEEEVQLDGCFITWMSGPHSIAEHRFLKRLASEKFNTST